MRWRREGVVYLGNRGGVGLYRLSYGRIRGKIQIWKRREERINELKYS